ncbi:MAG: DUF4175 family protein, partial [Saprospiraceae bacterium]
LKYALPPLLLLIVIMVASPAWITDGTRRLVNNNEEFERPAPFKFTVTNPELQVVQFADFPLTIRVEGDILPNEVFIEIDNYQYRLQKVAPNEFTYRFAGVRQDVDFRLFSGRVKSKAYELSVLKKPNIVNFNVRLDYPAYLGRTDEVLSNIGDLSVPVGTRIDWEFTTENTDHIDLFFSGDETAEIERAGQDRFLFKRRANRDEQYRLVVSNDRLPRADSVAYSLNVVPDLYPEISVEKFIDSTDSKLLYFVGDAADDHGLTRLNFVYTLKRAEGGDAQPKTVSILKPTGKQARYDYVWDLRELAPQPGDELSYYFEVYDNDGVNGAKPSRTGMMTYQLPTRDELEEQAEANSELLKDKLKEAIKESKEVKEEMKKLREKLLQEKEMDWKMKKELEKLMERQQQVQEKIEEAQEAFEEKKRNEEELSPAEENIKKKEEQLEKMMQEAMNEEMEKLMEEIRELMEKLEKEEALDKMEQMELSNEETEKELDRLQELYKELELEKKMQETIEKLEELAEEQEKLAEETAAEEKPTEELKKEQEDIQKEFDKIQEDVEKMEKMNEELEKPTDMDPQEEMQESIEEDMEKAQDKMEDSKPSEASDSQKKAGQKMKQMANSMQMQMQAQQQKEQGEDIEAMRQLLENIVGLSFDQEALMRDFSAATVNTPRYVSLVQEQFRVKDDFRLVEDSLRALAKRNIDIETFVLDKVNDIKGNLRQGLDDLEERRKPQASDQQQRAMTNLNDLALMMSESLEKMQQQMAGMMPGNQACENPGEGKGEGKKPSDKPGEGGGEGEGQKGLNEDMKGLQKKMGKGEGKAGAEEFARMAARQAALRRALEKKQADRRSKGKGDPELQELIDEMNKSEEDLVNKRLTNETMQRQQDILGRLLEHEKAERERDQDEQRKSKTADQQRREMPATLQEYIKQRQAEVDMFKRVSPDLKPYYQSLVDEYFQQLRGGNTAPAANPGTGR